MSSWYIFNSLGFYPANPASGEYLIGSPLFDHVSITLPQTGKVLSIAAPGARTKQFVKSVSLDGQPSVSPVLTHSDLMKTTELSFEMSHLPQDWGKNTL
jgi:putative alpha-1,2-mannosidase